MAAPSAADEILQSQDADATAILGEHVAGEVLYDPASDLRFGFECLQALKHFHISRVHKMTPSGRQQSAVFVVLSDAVLLCSNRGGIHRYIPFAALSAVRLFTRGKVTFYVEDEHDLVIATAAASKIVLVMIQLIDTKGGKPLKVEHDDGNPILEDLDMRPSNRFKSKLPLELKQTLQAAKLAINKRRLELAKSTLLQSPDKGQTPAAGHQQPTASPDRTRTSQGADASPSRRFTDPSMMSSPASRGYALEDMGEFPNESMASRRSVSQSHTEAPRYTPAATMAASMNAAADLKAPMVNPKPSAIGKARTGHGTEDAPNALSDDLTVLIVESHGSVVTYPSVVSIWRYLCFVADHMPGSQQLPVATIKCVEDMEKPRTINITLLFQTMAISAASLPHVVTVQHNQTAEGYHLDGAVFWIPGNENTSVKVVTTEMSF